jgi:hypothetical protein
MDHSVILRLEVDAMRYGIAQALHARELELQQIVQEEMDKTFSRINLGDMVQNEINRMLPELIRKTLEAHIMRVLYHGEANDKLGEIVEKGIASFFKESSR